LADFWAVLVEERQSGEDAKAVNHVEQMYQSKCFRSPLTPTPLPSGERGRGEGVGTAARTWCAALMALSFTPGGYYAKIVYKVIHERDSMLD
jgi:hypothetical protein